VVVAAPAGRRAGARSGTARKIAAASGRSAGGVHAAVRLRDRRLGADRAGRVLEGRLDFGWLGAWALLLATMLPLQWLGTVLDAGFALRAGSLLKSRLLAGALRMDLDQVRRQGAGHAAGPRDRVAGAGNAGLGGGVACWWRSWSSAFAAWVLSLGAAPRPHLALLAAGCRTDRAGCLALRRAPAAIGRVTRLA
jgi:hypothetical protein